MKKQVNNMNERELDRAKVETYKRVVEFARDAVKKQNDYLLQKIQELEDNYNQLFASGADFNSSSVRAIEEDIRNNKKLQEKTKKDLDLLNDILRRIERDVINCIDPIKKRFELEKLNKLIDDINFVHDSASRDTRLREIEREIENVKNTYDRRIMNERDSIKRRDLGSEREQKLNNLNDRASRLNRYVGLNITDRTNLIDSINRDIANLNSKTVKSYEEQLEDTILLVKPLFTKYENNYGGQDVSVKEYGGESMFKYIMKTTDTYAKMGNKIDEMEQKLSIVNAKNISKGKDPYDLNQRLKGEVSKNQMLPYRIRDMKRKQASIHFEQRLIMLKRQNVIDKKNKKISKLEAKSEQLKKDSNIKTANNFVTKKIESLNSIRRKFKAMRIDLRINIMKKKPIFLLSNRAFLLKEQFKDEILKKSTDKYGNWDTRSWQERAIERMEDKKYNERDKKRRKY